MGQMYCLRFVCCIFVLSSFAVADDSIPIEMLQRLKKSTVYVKTEVGSVKISGSGFVIEVTGTSALIATNQHVVGKPKELTEGGYILGLRGRDRLALLNLQRSLASAEPSVSVVFNSGNPGEKTCKAELLGAIESPDLAILKVTDIPANVEAVRFRDSVEPIETTSVWLFGFPFGDTLSVTKGNPAITIGKGSVSSVRHDDQGRLAMVQIDGALNPGNSGGPVVNVKGDLIGIAVQTIQGSNIGLAIPPRELCSVLDGRVGNPITVTTKVEKQKSAATYEIAVPVIDPMKKLKSVALRYVDGPASIELTKSGQEQLQSKEPIRKLTLTMGPRNATGVLDLKSQSAQQSREITVQAECVTSDGKTHYAEPVVVAVKPPVNVETSIVKEGNKQTITQTIETPGGGVARRQITIQRGRGSSKSKKLADDQSNDSNDLEMNVASTSGASSDKESPASEEEPIAEDADKDKKEKVTAVWTNKISNMKKIPNTEVAGKIDGMDFKLDKVTLSDTRLSFVMGPRFHGVFSEASLDLALFNVRNRDLSGQKCVVNGRIRSGDPHVRASTMRKGDRLPRSDGFLEYLMVLEFGKYNAEDRIQPGKIYICLPDRGKSFLAGTFEAAVE